MLFGLAKNNAVFKGSRFLFSNRRWKGKTRPLLNLVISMHWMEMNVFKCPKVAVRYSRGENLFSRFAPTLSFTTEPPGWVDYESKHSKMVRSFFKNATWLNRNLALEMMRVCQNREEFAVTSLRALNNVWVTRRNPTTATSAHQHLSFDLIPMYIIIYSACHYFYDMDGN